MRPDPLPTALAGACKRDPQPAAGVDVQDGRTVTLAGSRLYIEYHPALEALVESGPDGCVVKLTVRGAAIDFLRGEAELLARMLQRQPPIDAVEGPVYVVTDEEMAAFSVAEPSVPALTRFAVVSEESGVVSSLHL